MTTLEAPADTLDSAPKLDYPAFDADNHYYEALDAFTRHLDPTLGPRMRAVVPRSTAASTTWSAAG